MKYIYAIIFVTLLPPLWRVTHICLLISFINYFLKFINRLFTLLSAMIIVENLLY